MVTEYPAGPGLDAKIWELKYGPVSFLDCDGFLTPIRGGLICSCGWVGVPGDKSHTRITFGFPKFSTDIMMAWGLVRDYYSIRVPHSPPVGNTVMATIFLELRKDGWHCGWKYYYDNYDGSEHVPIEFYKAVSPSAPHAISLAVLLAISESKRRRS